MPTMKTNDWLLGGGAIVGLIATFLPWYGYSSSCSGTIYCGASVSESGFTSWGILFFLAALVLVVFAALRMFATGVNLPALPLQDWLIYLILSLIMVAAAAIFWLSGGGYGVSYNGPGGSVGPSFGLFVALVAAVAAAVGAFLKKTDPQPATGPMNFGTPPSAAPPPPPPAPPAPPAPPTA